MTARREEDKSQNHPRVEPWKIPGRVKKSLSHIKLIEENKKRTERVPFST